jgi:hypothetical protein
VPLAALPFSLLTGHPAPLQRWVENISGTRGAFKTYNTTTHKVNAWEPKVAPRQ